MPVYKLMSFITLSIALVANLIKERRFPWRVSQWMADKRVHAVRLVSDRKVLSSRPFLTGKCHPEFELHMLIGRKHVGMCLWSVKSFLLTTGKPFSVVLHDDGSLMHSDIRKLQTHLINARIVRKKDADTLMKEKLASFPNCWRYRFGSKQTTDHRGAGYNMWIFAIRLFDFNLTSAAEKTLVLDADVLFFRQPSEILAWATDLSVRGHLFSIEQYLPIRNVRKDIVGYELKDPRPRDANAGLLCFDKRSFNMNAIESWIGEHSEWMDKYATFEQAAYNHLIKTYGPADALPDSYSFNYTDDKVIATHFAIKQLFFENVRRVALSFA